MNAAYWHLILNHIPILGTLFGFLIMMYGWWIRSREVLRVALVLLIVCGLATLPVYYTGHNAEELVEDLSGISEFAIEHHEESAETTYYLMLTLGIAALGGLLQSYRTHFLSTWWILSIGLLALISIGSVVNTANNGGKIRHPEIEMGSSESLNQNTEPDHSEHNH